MNFPANGKQVEEIAEKVGRNFKEVLDGLMRSWRDLDPGKYRPGYFFLNKNLERVVVKEMLGKGVEIFTDRKRWLQHRKKDDYYKLPYRHVPPHLKAISLGEIALVSCPRCESLVPHIEHYEQTIDTPEGDQWIKEYLAVCTHCKATTTLEQKTSPDRF